MQIYVVIKAGLQEYGEFTMASSEKAFQDKGAAEAYLRSLPTTWVETISGVKYACERAIHEVELT